MLEKNFKNTINNIKEKIKETQLKTMVSANKNYL